MDNIEETEKLKAVVSHKFMVQTADGSLMACEGLVFPLGFFDFESSPSEDEL
jgi:hypothetical protein